MSYEGEEEHLCKNGHRWAMPCQYSFGEIDTQCPYCPEVSAWSNSIDHTNGESFGEIPEEEWKKLEISGGCICTCSCGNVHTKEEPRYRIPTEAELKKMRHFWNSETDQYSLVEEYCVGNEVNWEEAKLL